MSPFLLAAIINANRRNHHKGRYVSATALSGCVRKLKLERTVDYAEEPGKLFYSFRGTVTHVVVENAAEIKLFDGKSLVDLGFMSEWRMAIGFCFKHGGFPLPPDVDKHNQDTWDNVRCPYGKRCDCIVLGGTLDGLEPLWDLFDEETGVLPMVLHDLKTAQEYAVTKIITGDPDAKMHAKVNGIKVGHFKDEYVWQAQVYKYLGERDTPPEELARKGVKRIQIVESRLQYFAMGNWPYAGSTYKFRKHYKHDWTHWEIPTIKFLEDKAIEAYIKERAWPIYQSLVLDKERGPICEPADNNYEAHSWLCGGFCAFHRTTYCPAPEIEWGALQEGKTPDEAFEIALKVLGAEEN